EDRVVLRAVLGVLRRRIEDRDPLPHEEPVEATHLLAAAHAEREVVEADPVAVEHRVALRRAKHDGEVSVGPRDVCRVRHAAEAEGAENLLVEGNRARERSEEHTSELQSLAYLVCRLLLEKKKLKIVD